MPKVGVAHAGRRVLLLVADRERQGVLTEDGFDLKAQPSS